ncbi:MAG TPA: C-terminal helicase domain-containing protein, partial [Bacteroidales bacterium]|nr:C-terminal helicase domain-containing protein [Bacteroidales bacterium]
VLQAVYPVYENQKIPLIRHLIDDKPEYKTILIFSSTKRKVSEIVRELKNREYTVAGISSDLEQKQREDVLRQFMARKTRVLVATDVLSRGIDIKDIDLIINFDAPGDAEDYVHRVGRTARARATGVALTLVNPDDMYKFRKIEQLIGSEVMKLPVPADIGTGPEWTNNPKRPYSKPRRSFNKRSKK